MTRQNFYQGQCVTPEHLNTLQDYTDSGCANLISSLLGYGIVEGLNVSVAGGNVVDVASGLAFNLVGERLILAESRKVDFSQYTPSTGKETIKLGIAIDYIQSDTVVDEFGNTAYTKSTPTVQFITGETLDSGVFELAEVTLSSTGVDSIKNTGVGFDTLPKVEANLQEEIDSTNERMSALVTNGSTTTLTSQILKLIASGQMSLESSLINLITSNFRINGISYMDIGSNGNGTYIKFENGLLICIATMNNGTTTWTYPHSFIQLLYHNVGLVYGETVYAAQVSRTLTVTTTYAISQGRVLSTSGGTAIYSGSNYRLAIGFWK